MSVRAPFRPNREAQVRSGRAPAARRVLPLGAAVLGLLLAGPASAFQGNKPDQVFYRNARGDIRIDSGTVTENSLSQTVVESADGQSTKHGSAVVQRVVFGHVPAAYVDGQAYVDRGDLENAVAKFRVAAGDQDASEPVRARARFLAATTLLQSGAKDRSAFEQAHAELETFLSDHPQDRDVPEARTLLGRAALLTGDFAGAAEAYHALYGEAAGGTPAEGYPLALCYEAGMASARAALLAKDVPSAEETLGSIESTLPALLASLEESDPERPRLLAVQTQARLGEGWVLLAKDQASQAETFFRTQLKSAAPQDDELRFGAQLGLGEALLAGGKTREAEIELAQVSALDHRSRDRVARALVDLASCALKLPDKDARDEARTWTQTVLDRYADTPAALRAQELEKSL